MRRVFVCFLEEIEDSKKAFRNDLTYYCTYLLQKIEEETLEMITCEVADY